MVVFGIHHSHEEESGSVGAIHSWKFDQDVNIAAGFYYTIKNWNIYLWGNDFLKSHPRVVVGVDFAL